MTQSKLLLVVAMTVLMFGFAGAKSSSAAQMQKDVVIAAEDAAPDDESGTGSAKMGEGTQTGDQGATKENDTQKVDQPPRRNPTTGTGDYQEEGAPSDDDQDTDR